VRPIPILAGLGLLAAAAGTAVRVGTYEISENSMAPALNHGDWVAAWTRPGRIRRGDVVIFEHPARPGFDLVKRVTAVTGDHPGGMPRPLGEDEVWVTGDNPDAGSVDSTSFGPIRAAEISARVLLRYSPLPPAPMARRYTSR